MRRRRRGRRRNGASALSSAVGIGAGEPHARRRVGRDRRFAHARRHAVRAERRRHDAAGVDDEDVHVRRRARPVRPGLHVPDAGAARRQRRPRRHARRQSLPARRRRSVDELALLARRSADGRAREAGRGGGHQARARRHHRRRQRVRRQARSRRLEDELPRRRVRGARVGAVAERESRLGRGAARGRQSARRRSSRRRRRFRSRAPCGRRRLAAGASARRGAPTAASSCAARSARTRARSSTRSSSTIRRCSRPARCAPRSRKRASRSTARRVSARRRPARRRSRRSRRRRSRRSSARWIARASTSCAELLFRAAAHAATNQVGSAETGLANLREFLSKKVGTSPNFVDVADGSGLSQLDRVTPRSMVQLLGYVHRADWGPAFHAALPVEGESGTLKRRSKGTPARGNLHAKTGTTNTVAALGGYVTAQERRGARVLADLQRQRPLERQGGDGPDRRDDGGVRSGVGVIPSEAQDLERGDSVTPLRSYDSLMSIPRLRSSSMYSRAGMHSSGVCTPAGFTCAAHLHQPGDRQRVARRPHHRADAVLLVVPIDELERARRRARRPSCPSRRRAARRDRGPSAS